MMAGMNNYLKGLLALTVSASLALPARADDAAALVEAGGTATNTPVATGTAAPVEEPEAETGTIDSFFNGDLPDAIGQSQINFQWRPRYEYADTEASNPSQAWTMRTVFGLTTAEIYGFQGMIEGLNVLTPAPDRYYAGDNPDQSDKTTVLDPSTTEINQVWLSYHYEDWQTGAKGGRQIINLDNQRFVGAVDWRQNPQTFDAFRIGNSSVKNLDLMYTYIGRVNRVGGNVSGLTAGAKDFQSSSHVIHASYDSCDYANVTGYIYLLDLNNGGLGDGASCATYGLSIEGAAPINEDIKLDYRGELAFQTDYADNPSSYNAPYLHLTLGTKVQAVSFGVGYELLGSDNGAGFQTPLATLHKFNGWADVFMTTPGTGLQDFYAYAQVQLPWEMPLKVALHKFDASNGGRFNYGNELDIALSRKFGKHWSGLIKYAYYDAKNALAPGGFNADVHKFWAQVNFSLCAD
jgi:hypothetical protein